MNLKEITDYIQKDCDNNKAELVLKDQENVLVNGVECLGYFTHAPTPKLVVSTKAPEESVTGLLLHEYFHLRQFIEKADVWNNLKVQGFSIMSTDIIDLWLNQEIDLSALKVQDHIFKLIEVEADCEKRVVDFVTKNNINIDLDLYIKKANAYILSYHLVGLYRKWISGIYNNKEILDKMPNCLLKNYLEPDESLLRDIEKLFIR